MPVKREQELRAQLLASNEQIIKTRFIFHPKWILIQRILWPAPAPTDVVVKYGISR